MTIEAPPHSRSQGLLWFDEFDIGPTAVTYRKTGARVRYSRSLVQELWGWLRFFFAIRRQARAMRTDFKIAFYPDRGRPWYLIWAVVRLAGGAIVRPAAADIVMHFEDATYSPNSPPSAAKPSARLLNFHATDVSKSRIAGAFEAAFGYALALDPRDHAGPAVEKSELNGAHDGRIVHCPIDPAPGRVYQRLIDNRAARPELVEDLRCPTIGGRPICVFVKRRDETERFANANVEVELKSPEHVFSADELARIAEFTALLGLDWGGLDVLRDRTEGRLYIVDANKTDMGPPTALPLPAKLYASRLLAQAFRDFVGLPESARRN